MAGVIHPLEPQTSSNASDGAPVSGTFRSVAATARWSGYGVARSASDPKDLTVEEDITSGRRVS